MTLQEILSLINQANSIQDFAQDNLLKLAESGDGRFILNYNEQQLGTPKNWISHYCRGLTLVGEPSNYQIIAKSFNRFYNIGENPEYLEGQNQIDWDKNFEVQFKYDGSLILLYYWNGAWRVNTRGSFAKGNVSSVCSYSWEELFWKGINEFCDNKYDGNFAGLNIDYTYIFELCSPYNQVVEYYPETKIIYLGSVYIEKKEKNPFVENILVKLNITPLENYTETWKNDLWLQYRWRDKELGSVISIKSIDKPIIYKCQSQEDVIQLLDTLKPTQEGFVIAQWDDINKNYIRRKCKTKTWAALAHLKGGINTLKGLWNLVFSGDIGEVISIFPHLKDELENKETQYLYLQKEIHYMLLKYQEIEDKKQFALLIKDSPYSGALFSLKNGKSTLVEATQKFILSNYV